MSTPPLKVKSDSPAVHNGDHKITDSQPQPGSAQDIAAPSTPALGPQVRGNETDARQQDAGQRGRLPWYTPLGGRKKPFMIGVTGGTASGKTTVCRAVVEQLNMPWVLLLSMDRYYKTLPDDADPLTYNFDHPSMFRVGLLFGLLCLVPMYVHLDTSLCECVSVCVCPSLSLSLLNSLS
jgi:hypothetical protein